MLAFQDGRAAMSTAESAKTLAGRPWPNGDPATWVYLDELPTPPEVAALVEQERRRNGWWWRWWWKKEIAYCTRERKRQHYFPGKQLVFRFTPRGWLILLVAPPSAPEIDAFFSALPRGERGGVGIDYVSDPDEPDATRLPSCYELNEGSA
jgi:hypothetical protein